MTANQGIEQRVVDLYGQRGYAAFYAKWRAQLVDFASLDQHIPKAGVVLDFGCGYGLLSNLLAMSSPEREVIGVDSSTYRIEKADSSKRGQRVRFIAGDIFEVELPPCDAVVMVDFVHHLPVELQPRVIERAASLLKPGGVLMIKEVDKNSLHGYPISRLFELVVKREIIMVPSASELDAIFAGCGMSKPVRHPMPGLFASTVFVGTKQAN